MGGAICPNVVSRVGFTPPFPVGATSPPGARALSRPQPPAEPIPPPPRSSSPRSSESHAPPSHRAHSSSALPALQVRCRWSRGTRVGGAPSRPPPCVPPGVRVQLPRSCCPFLANRLPPDRRICKFLLDSGQHSTLHLLFHADRPSPQHGRSEGPCASPLWSRDGLLWAVL